MPSQSVRSVRRITDLSTTGAVVFNGDRGHERTVAAVALIPAAVAFEADGLSRSFHRPLPGRDYCGTVGLRAGEVIDQACLDS
jgi:hypothetical protein